MDRGHNIPVSRRTRLQMNLSSRKEYSESPRSSRMGPKHLSREASPKIDRKLTPNPNAVREVEFLLVDPVGTVLKKFYFDLDSKDEGKGKGTTSFQPIILSDDEDEEEQVGPKDSSANRQESMPLKKRKKFDDQELPGSRLKGVDAQSCRDMKGEKLFEEKLFKDIKGEKLLKDIKGEKLFKDIKGEKLFKGIKGDKLFKDMNSSTLKPKEIKAEKSLGRNVKKELMEA